MSEPGHAPFAPLLDSGEALAADGPLARHIDGFAVRPEQQAMAAAVERALAERGRLVAEAGTGTGKTFAYLVPALLSGMKVVVSTGTRTLQDQLFHRDLPMVREALELPLQAALLKGRANYLCPHRLAVGASEARLSSAAQVADLERIRRWAETTRRGDIAEVGGVAEDSPLWPQVTSTVDNCLGQECPEYAGCFVLKARREAQEAELVVVNHHLLFADMVLKEEGFGELLPGADAFILDEAHQLPEVASLFFGQSLGSRQLIELARDSEGEHLKECGGREALPASLDGLQKAVRDLRLAFGMDSRRGAWRELAGEMVVRSRLAAVEEALGDLAGWLAAQSERSKGLESCARRAQELQARLGLLTGPADDSWIQWFETRPRSFTLYLTPLEVAGPFQERMQRQPAGWIFTSATLAVGDSFDHFAARLGLDEAETLRVDSPFDYARNALLYVPSGLPEPSARHYTEAVLEAALPVLEASRGRAFLLFTSHRALRFAADYLEARLDYPLLVQGSAPRNELLERFRGLGNAVLLGTGSFWEGVDVRGEALSLVVIDKLPFAAPDDPVLTARIDALRREGRNPFMEYQVPNAVIALKQGAGRLIRDVNDRGVMMLCDPRLFTKAYGRVFRRSLPPMPLSRELGDVRAFFAGGEGG